jgi:CubicO group peptidase (beta-lactamase class C family)
LGAGSILDQTHRRTYCFIDPEKDLYVALLTNRVHPNRSNDAILRVRRAVHDAVIGELR